MTRGDEGGGESRSNSGESGGENGESGGGNPNPRDCDPVRDESIPRPPRKDNDRRDHDYFWPVPERNPPTVSMNASGGYGTEVRPSGSSRVAESTVGVSGGGTLLPTVEIGNFNS